MLNLDLGFILWNLCVNVWNKVWGGGVGVLTLELRLEA